MPEYTLDLNSIASREALHRALAEAFSFPDYYGGNWDAFDECIAEIALPASVTVHGFEGFKFRLPGDAQLLIECFRAAAEQFPPGELTVHGVP